MANPETTENGQIDPRDLRNAFGTFATGVTIVTTREPGGIPRGFTANSFTSVSLDPPLVLVCVGKSAASCQTFSEAAGFAVNILHEGQRDLSGLFATQRADKFDAVPWRWGHLNLPLLDDTLSQFECEREQCVDAGDHLILIGRVKHYSYRKGLPLGYVNGAYFSLGIEQSLIDAVSKGEAVEIGAVLESNGRVLMSKQPGHDGWQLPTIGGDGDSASLEGLKKYLASLGLTCSITGLYAVFEDKGSGRHSIYYRGTVDTPQSTDLEASDDHSLSNIDMVPVGALPLDHLDGPAPHAIRSMLTRFAREYEQGRFAVYLGDDVSGTVRASGKE